MRFCASVTKSFGSEEGAVAWSVAVRLTILLCMLTRRESLLTLGTFQTEVVPILPQGSLPFSFTVDKQIRTVDKHRPYQHTYQSTLLFHTLDTWASSLQHTPPPSLLASLQILLSMSSSSTVCFVGVAEIEGAKLDSFPSPIRGTSLGQS